jgi:hypothetical protein
MRRIVEKIRGLGARTAQFAHGAERAQDGGSVAGAVRRSVIGHGHLENVLVNDERYWFSCLS